MMSVCFHVSSFPPQSLHILSSSFSQYLPSLISFSNLNLVILFYFFSPHFFFKYPGIPPPPSLSYTIYYISNYLSFSHLSFLCLIFYHHPTQPVPLFFLLHILYPISSFLKEIPFFYLLIRPLSTLLSPISYFLLT